MNSPKSNALPACLSELPPAAGYCVAYSGGVDSHVLLHLLNERKASLGASLSAVHVDHGLQTRSQHWAAHCRNVCEDLGVPMDLLCVNAAPAQGESPEAAARTARYNALAQWLPPGTLLLTAQHRDDQAETLLLQLFRGAGPKGLAAMPLSAVLGEGRLFRPMLDCSRDDILDYARQHQLHWIEDPSNSDTRFDRNLLRHEIFPRLRANWPGIGTVLARSAALQAEQAELAAQLAQQDLESIEIAGKPLQLSCERLSLLDPARQRNLLRHWIRLNGFPLPPQDVLERVFDELVTAREDATPLVSWPGAELRRYRGIAFLMQPLEPPLQTRRYTWNGVESLRLPGGLLTSSPGAAAGIRIRSGQQFEVGCRQGGERIRLAGRAGRRTLKHLFQEWAIPDWERCRVPLVYIDGELAAVAGLCVDAAHQAAPGETGLALHWSRFERLA